MDQAPVADVVDRNTFLVRTLKPASSVWILQRPASQDSLELKYERRREAISHPSNELQAVVVVQDHLLAPVNRWTAGPE